MRPGRDQPGVGQRLALFGHKCLNPIRLWLRHSVGEYPVSIRQNRFGGAPVADPARGRCRWFAPGRRPALLQSGFAECLQYPRRPVTGKSVRNSVLRKRMRNDDRGRLWEPTACLWQRGVAHQVAVALAGGAAAFVEGPDHQALAAAAVAGGEDALEAGGVFLVLGLDVGARVALDAELRRAAAVRVRGSPSPAGRVARGGPSRCRGLPWA